MNALLRCGHGGATDSPPGLILQFLGGPRLSDAANDIAALTNASRGWRQFGDEAWDLLRNVYDWVLPSPLRLYRESIPIASWRRPWECRTGSARVHFFDELRRLMNLLKLMCRQNHGVYLANGEGGESMPCRFQERTHGPGSGRLRGTHTTVLFDEDIEFFAALQLISKSTPAMASEPIRVMVGPSFQSVDLSSPHLSGRFHLMSHEHEDFDVHDDGLFALHPSALSSSKDVALSVLNKLRECDATMVIGVNAQLGKMLAGAPPVDRRDDDDDGDESTNTDDAAWHDAIVDWGRHNVCENGPYLIFRSFCDGMYPSSFCAAATGGFYDVSKGQVEQLNGIVGGELLKLQEDYPVTMQPDVVSFVSIIVTACISVESIIFPLF